MEILSGLSGPRPEKGSRIMSAVSASRLRARLVCAASLAVLALPAIGHAQAPDGAVEEVIITGSRTIRDGSTAPTPVSVLGVEELQDASPRNYAEGLAALP